MNPEKTICPKCKKPALPEQDVIVITTFRPTKVIYFHRVCP